MLLFSRRKRQDRDAAAALYGAIVRQARHPEFYENLGVPDTAEGRFEMLALHMFAVSRRLLRGPDGDPRLARAVAEAFVADLDGNLREMGVGDLSVGKKVRRLYGAYRARAAALEAALAAEGGRDAMRREDALEAVIARHIYGDGGQRGAAVSMAAYARCLVARLDSVAAESVRTSAFEFAGPLALDTERE